MQLCAQTPPDAGQLRNQIERSLPSLLPQPKTEAPKPPPPLTSLPGAVLVREFRFTGNTLIPSAALEAAVADWRNRTLDFNQLQEAVAAAAQVYRNAGWVVRVYLPRQEITDGVVTIHVVEAAFGGVHIEADKAARIDPDRLRKSVEANQAPGQPLRAAALDRALLLMSELPGVNVAGSLREGQRQGESEIVLTVADAPLSTGDASVDNTGSRSTGAARVAANFYLNSPLRLADQAILNLVHTQGSDFARGAYSIPLGHDGWRIGFNTSLMRYRLVSADFSALNARGDSDASGLDLSYPLLRSRLASLSFVSTLDYKTFNNLSGGATTTRYSMTTWSAGVNGNLTDRLAGGGTSSAVVALGGGVVNLDGSPNQAADAATTRTAGHFNKLRYSASRLQVITESISLNALLSGQLAAKNLDSGEKFYLGGSGGVRAYPSGEGAGSAGSMINLELRWRPRENFMLSGFYDWGRVTVNRDNAFGGGALRNRFSLQGAGLAWAWSGADGKSIKTIWARRIGSNPNAASSGNDQDGSLVRDRFWLTASLPY
jgi:hemolysin activation/secretion protein